MSNFKSVGAGWVNSKNGKEFVVLKFNEDLLDIVNKEDVLSKMCLFPNKFKRQSKHPDYYIGAPVKDVT